MFILPFGSTEENGKQFRLVEIEAVLAGVTDFGVDWRGTRFATYREEFVACARNSSEFIAAFRANEKRRRLTFEMASQFLQLMLAETVWHRLDRALLRRALLTVVSGPELDPSDDDRPRNTLLELVAAAYLADRFAVSLTASDEDVRLDHPLLGQGAVECKRPKAVGNLLPNLNTLGAQLRKRKKHGSQFGVAVVGGDRIAQLAGAAYEGQSIHEVDSCMRKMAFTLVNRVEQDCADPACDLLPDACYSLIVLTGATLVRNPLHVRPVCQMLGAHLPTSPSAAALEAFSARADGPLAGFLAND